MIRYGNVSKILVVLAVSLSFFQYTYQSYLVILFPTLLVTTAFVLEWRLSLTEQKNRRVERISKNNTMKIVYYTLLATVVMFATGRVVNYAWPEDLQITSGATDALIYTNSMAVGEEALFRGVFTDGLVVYLPRLAMRFRGPLGLFFNPLNSMFRSKMFANFVQALVFMAYHTARYGSDGAAMIYCLVGGFCLGAVCIVSKLIDPAMFAHGFNNSYSWFEVYVLSGGQNV